MTTIRSSSQARRVLAGAVLAVLLGAAIDASAVTITTARIDWQSFTATTTDPGFAFIRDDGLYGTTATAFNQGFAADWTSPVDAGDASVRAAGDAAVLSASIVTPDTVSYPARSADITRSAGFNLDANSSVVFSVRASLSSDAADDPGNTAFASLAALGGDAGYRVDAVNLIGNGAAQSQSRLLRIMVANTTPQAINGFLSAEATVDAAALSVSPVPELPMALLMAPGLLLGIAGMTRRRRG